MNVNWSNRRITVPIAAVALTAAVACNDYRERMSADTTAESLVCHGEVSVQFSPSVNWQAKHIKATGSGTLDHCASLDGSHPHLKSARVEVSGSATETSCTQVGSGRGTVDITWYGGDNQSGQRLGTTRLVIDDLDRPLIGRTTDDSQVLPGRTATADGHPTSDLSRCPFGLKSASAAGEITFR
ncbi:hypothetical protein [Saccharothrix variisporea]|uniref:Uncharacterized protein n=1 Tax=Saccharothrix variisporea TaxID=543527 RepID=A0A495XJF1_9PSEU|nr:hypothetical protein [Saccharothrix variisporea]RKT74651.1 hypothetical protein DFJ66_8018 [Saccharothrix variisporea]